MDESALTAALCDTRAYPSPTSRVEMHETHISRVFLVGDFAYKVRKPVKLDYVDFSTLDRRRADCEQELQLNSRYAPELYLDVVPIVAARVAPGVRVGGDGTPLEYAVRIRRFPDGALFSEMVAAQQLTPAHIDLLGRRIAAMHDQQPRAPASSSFGTATRIWKTVAGVLSALEALPGDAHRLATVTSHIKQRWPKLQGAFTARLAHGHVRECHGDLHLGNIAWLDGRPVPFDCLEFDPALRWIDTMSDIAFVFMDLLHHERPDLAWRFLNGYLEASGDYAGLVVLPFHAAARALIRAQVLLERQLQATLPALAATPDSKSEPDRLLDLAHALLSRQAAAMYLMHGVSGSGKSTVAAAMAESEGMIRVRSDVERKLLRQRGPGAQAYGADETARTYGRLLAVCRLACRAGLPVIADATFLDQRWRARFFAQATRLGVNCNLVHCSATPEVLRARIAARAKLGTDASEADLAVLEHQLRTQDPLGQEEWPSVLRPASC